MPLRTTHIMKQEWLIGYIMWTCRSFVISIQLTACQFWSNKYIDFDIASATTWEHSGKRSINIRNTGSSKRCTVLLAVTLSGVKLPPFIIFEGQPGERSRIKNESKDPKFGYPQSNFFTVQPKAWDDQHTHLEWCEKVWFPFCDQQQNGNYTYLIHDEFKVHLMGKVIHFKHLTPVLY